MKDIIRRIFKKPPDETRKVSPEEMDRILSGVPLENNVYINPLSDITFPISELASRGGKNPSEVIKGIEDERNSVAQVLLSQGDVDSLDEGTNRAKELIILNPDATVTYTLDYITSSYIRFGKNN